MKIKPPADVNDLLLRLYVIAQEQPVEQFQSTALALLKPVLTFEAAIWGQGQEEKVGLTFTVFICTKNARDGVSV